MCGRRFRLALCLTLRLGVGFAVLGGGWSFPGQQRVFHVAEPYLLPGGCFSRLVKWLVSYG